MRLDVYLANEGKRQPGHSLTCCSNLQVVLAQKTSKNTVFHFNYFSNFTFVYSSYFSRFIPETFKVCSFSKKRKVMEVEVKDPGSLMSSADGENRKTVLRKEELEKTKKQRGGRNVNSRMKDCTTTTW